MIKAVLSIDSSTKAEVWGMQHLRTFFFLMEAFVNIRYLINLGLQTTEVLRLSPERW